MTDPIAAYSFDSANASDATTNGNDGTLVGTNITWTAGHTSGGANSSGTATASYIAVPDAVGIRPASAVTVEAWVKMNSTQATSSAFIIGKCRSGGDESWSIYAGATNTLFGVVVGTSTSVFANDTSGTGAICDDTWHHVAGTYDGTNVRLWIDGVNTATTAGTGSLAYDTSPFCMGGSSSHSSDRMVGILDDVRVYDTALVGTDIGTDMTTPVGGSGGGGGSPSGFDLYALRGGSWQPCTVYALRDGVWTEI